MQREYGVHDCDYIHQECIEEPPEGGDGNIIQAGGFDDLLAFDDVFNQSWLVRDLPQGVMRDLGGQRRPHLQESRLDRLDFHKTCTPGAPCVSTIWSSV